MSLPLNPSQSDPQTKSLLARFNQQKWVNFSFCFALYVSCHMCRSVWSFCGSQITTQGISKVQFGYTNTAFLFFYGFGQATYGHQGDHFNLKIFVVLGSLLAAICVFSIGLIGELEGYPIFWVMLLLMSLNGFFQATNHPGIVSILGNWFSRKSRGKALGFWAGSQNWGDILGYQIGQGIINMQNLAYFVALYVSSGVYALMACLFFIVVQPNSQTYRKQLSKLEPLENISISDSNSSIQETSNIQASKQKSENPSSVDPNPIKINFINAWKIKNVPLYAISYACMKGISYCLLLWLPYYLKQYSFSKQYGAYISQMNDYGAIVGAFIIGVITDSLFKKLKLESRIIIIVPALIISAICQLLVVLCTKDEPGAYFILIFFIGITLGGPYNLIGGAISIDIANQDELKNNKKASTAIVSVINGTGAFFAAFCQIVVAYIPTEDTFWLFLALTSVAIIALFPKFLQDIKFFMQASRDYSALQAPILITKE